MSPPPPYQAYPVVDFHRSRLPLNGEYRRRTQSESDVSVVADNQVRQQVREETQTTTGKPVKSKTFSIKNRHFNFFESKKAFDKQNS